jgi:rhodanese-related sulfurtransferase
MRRSAIEVRKLLAGAGACFLTLAAPNPAPAEAATASLSQMAAACSAGKEQQSNEDVQIGDRVSKAMPLALPGVRTVSAREAKCLLDRFEDRVVPVAVLSTGKVIENSWAIPELAVASQSAEKAKQAGAMTDFVLGGDRKKALLVYCHHYRCAWSKDGAMWLSAAGYDVFWMRPGVDGWASAGFPMHAKPAEQLRVTQSKARIFTANAMSKCDTPWPEYTSSNQERVRQQNGAYMSRLRRCYSDIPEYLFVLSNSPRADADAHLASIEETLHTRGANHVNRYRVQASEVNEEEKAEQRRTEDRALSNFLKQTDPKD